MNTWKTQDGKRIKYKDLTDVHLLRILKYIERQATDGLLIGNRYLVDYELIYGNEAKEWLNYKNLCKLAKSRGII